MAWLAWACRGGEFLADTHLGSNALQHVVHGTLGEVLALTRGEEEIASTGVATQREQRATYDLRQQDLAPLAALAQHVELHLAVLALDDIRPCQGDELGDAKAPGVANLDQQPIPAIAGRPYEQAHLNLGDDPLRHGAGFAAHL